MKDYYYLGLVSRKYSFKGEVLIKIDTDQPEIYKKIKCLYININENLCLYNIENVRFHKSKVLRVKFKEINDEEETKLILSKEIYLPLSGLPKLNGNNFYYHEIINFNLIDKIYGNIGSINEVRENNAQDLFVINNPNGQVLIPIHDEFIIKVDRLNCEITTKCPDGLIDIYLE